MSNPAEFLKTVLGRPVICKLNKLRTLLSCWSLVSCLTPLGSGVIYRGILVALDGYLNVALEQTEEYVSGQLKNRFNDVFLRGNNLLYISSE